MTKYMYVYTCIHVCWKLLGNRCGWNVHKSVILLLTSIWFRCYDKLLGTLDLSVMISLHLCVTWSMSWSWMRVCSIRRVMYIHVHVFIILQRSFQPKSDNTMQLQPHPPSSNHLKHNNFMRVRERWN